jgi:hypothetical protein
MYNTFNYVIFLHTSDKRKHFISLEKHKMCQAWWHRPIILAFKRLKQEDSTFEVSLGCIERLFLQKAKQNNGEEREGNRRQRKGEKERRREKGKEERKELKC